MQAQKPGHVTTVSTSIYVQQNYVPNESILHNKYCFKVYIENKNIDIFNWHKNIIHL